MYTEDPKIRSMRIRAWYRAVATASQLGPRELEEKFSVGVGNGRRSCIWDKYRRGEVEPGRGIDRKLGVVDRVEKAYPGTRRWLLLALWRLADKQPLEMSEIRKAYEGLPKLIRSIFVGDGKPAGLFWRRPVDTDHACEILLRISSEDALTALLALIREGETTQNQDQHFSAWYFAQRHLAQLSANSPIFGEAIGRELHAYIGNYCEDPGYIELNDADGLKSQSSAS